MCTALFYEVLRCVIKYLTQTEIYSVSLIDSYWKNIAMEESFRRGPMCLKLISNNDIAWPCQYLPRNCTSIIMEVFKPLNYKALLFNLSFPCSRKIQVNTFTFVNVPNSSLIICPELHYASGPSFEPPSDMENILKRYFDKKNRMKSCMILICDLEHSYLLVDFIGTLSTWFPKSRISYWGGITKKIFYCKNSACMAVTSGILIFISNKNLKTWCTGWPAQHKSTDIVEQRLMALKRDIELKTYSMAFIYIAGIRYYDDLFLECDLFEKYFPNVPYVYLNGPGAFGGNKLKALFKKMSEFKPLWPGGPKVSGDDETSIMILTYD
ncbi:hypothetical protein M0802_005836 [Mischocyttarus mexicanus]|nr:hypothetical protein M0802_005836 [Mischocyttarus mexicanus]